MIDVSSRIKKAFQNDSMPKHYYISFPNIDESSDFNLLGNHDIVEDSFKLEENLNSEDQLHFGRCEGNVVEFEMFYDARSLVGEIIDIYLVLGDYIDEPFTVGRYIISSEKIANDRLTKTITAYDILSILNDLDVTYWYYTYVHFPISIKDLRNSLFAYVGQEQVETDLINDNIVLFNPPFVNEMNITFNSVISPICEVNAVFGGIDRTGKFKYYSLTPVSDEETYPSRTLFPSSMTFPQSIRGTSHFIDPHLIKDDITWENYVCKVIDIIQLRNSSGVPVLDYTIPDRTGTNIYVIQSNYIIDAMSSSDWTTMVRNFAQAVYKISYRPCTASIKMDLSYEVGDPLTLTTTDGTKITTFILKRTSSGDIVAFDEIEAVGNEEYINEIAQDDTSAYDELQDEVNELSDRVSDIETDGGIVIESVKSLPSSPRKNVLYLVQGEVWVT